MKVCIVCQMDMEGKKGLRVKEDRIIAAIRSVKKLLGIAQMNELFVCESDVQKHADRRKSFERSIIISVVLAAIVVLLLLSSMLLSGNFSLWGALSGFVIGFFLLVLPLFRYVPAVEGSSSFNLPFFMQNPQPKNPEQKTGTVASVKQKSENENLQRVQKKGKNFKILSR